MKVATNAVNTYQPVGLDFIIATNAQIKTRITRMSTLLEKVGSFIPFLNQRPPPIVEMRFSMVEARTACTTDSPRNFLNIIA